MIPRVSSDGIAKADGCYRVECHFPQDGQQILIALIETSSFPKEQPGALIA